MVIVACCPPASEQPAGSVIVTVSDPPPLTYPGSTGTHAAPPVKPEANVTFWVGDAAKNALGMTTMILSPAASAPGSDGVKPTVQVVATLPARRSAPKVTPDTREPVATRVTVEADVAGVGSSEVAIVKPVYAPAGGFVTSIVTVADVPFAIEQPAGIVTVTLQPEPTDPDTDPEVTAEHPLRVTLVVGIVITNPAGTVTVTVSPGVSAPP